MKQSWKSFRYFAHARSRTQASTHALAHATRTFFRKRQRKEYGGERVRRENCSCPPRQLHAYSTHCLTIPSPDETVSINRQIPFHSILSRAHTRTRRMEFERIILLERGRVTMDRVYRWKISLYGDTRIV